MSPSSVWPLVGRSCSPSELRAWSWSFQRCKITSLILTPYSMGRVAKWASCPLPLGAEDRRCARQGRGQGAAHLGPQPWGCLKAEPQPQVALPGGCGVSITWSWRSSLSAQSYEHQLVPVSPLTSAGPAHHWGG